MRDDGKDEACPDEAYLLERAESELEAARSARHPRAAKAHFHLAGLLFDRFFRRSEGRRRTLSLKFQVPEPEVIEPRQSRN